MRIIAEKMVPGGQCFARIEGKATFITGALPGETLEISVTSEKKDYSFAKINAVLEPSPHRIAPPCPHFGLCGGCSLQMADSAFQTELRKGILAEALSRAHVPCPDEITAVTGDSFGYRSRFQFHRFSPSSVGIKESSSDRIVPIRDCPVAVPAIRSALADGSLAAMSAGRRDGDRFHVFALGSSLWHEDRDSLCEIPLDGRRISFDVRGFFQSNVPLLERLVRYLGDDLKEQRKESCRDPVDINLPMGALLDFYAGVGTFSLCLGEGFAETVLLEHNRSALEAARVNMERAGIRARYLAASDESWPDLAESRRNYDFVIVDPPRSGLSRRTLRWFCESGTRNLRYVSCDPVTFARDAAALTAAGYALDRLFMYDFYPQTHHLETMGVFRR